MAFKALGSLGLNWSVKVQGSGLGFWIQASTSEASRISTSVGLKHDFFGLRVRGLAV